MALNFPADTNLPYVDPVSGLKYIFNDNIGGWETAIQPPCVVSETPPDLEIPGFLWWDSVGGSLFLRYADDNSEQWVECSPHGGDYQGVQVSAVEPGTKTEGDLWLDTSDPNNPVLKVWGLLDGDYQWIPVVAPPAVYGGPSITSGAAAPNGANNNTIWFDSENKELYIFRGGEWHQITRPQVASTSVQTITNTVEAPEASTTVAGVMRVGTQAEVNAGLLNNVVVVPNKLKQAIDNLMPEGKTNKVGGFYEATASDVNLGLADNRAITPKALRDSRFSSNPTGTVITFAGSSAPEGYLPCDGSTISRAQYAELFAVIGITYGIGDGTTTFTLPTSTGTFLQCIKH